MEFRGEDLSCCSKLHSIRWFMKMSLWSLARQRSVLQQYHRGLPTRWQRKPAGIEITSLSSYVWIVGASPPEWGIKYCDVHTPCFLLPFFPCSLLHKRVSFRPPTTQFNCRHPGVLWHQLTPFERAVAVRPSCGPAAADGSLLRFQSIYSTNVCEQKFSLSAQTAGLI